MISMWQTACFSESLSMFLRSISPFLSIKCDVGSKIVGFHLESVFTDEKNVLNASFKLIETNEVQIGMLVGSLVMDIDRWLVHWLWIWRGVCGCVL